MELDPGALQGYGDSTLYVSVAQGGRECIEQKQVSYIIFGTWNCCCWMVVSCMQYEVSAKEMNYKFQSWSDGVC